MNLKKLLLIFCCVSLAYLLSGCATLPSTYNLPTYSLNGVSYLALSPLCESRDINLEYDTYTQTAVLTKEMHKIKLRVGDNLVLVDNQPHYLGHSVDIYEGMLVVPYKFKDEVIDRLFKPYVSQPAIARVTSIRRVVIDAGHGGNDPGAIARTGLREKTVVLDIAKRLSNLLKRDGIDVVMTRSSDNFIPLTTRVSVANNYRADLFVSIHANANRVRSLHGFEVYYVASSVSDSQRALSSVNRKIPNLDSSCLLNPSYNLKVALWDMVYTYERAESIELSRALCREMSRNLDTRIIGIKGGRFYVLKGATMPAVLVEVGFLSNFNEERFLRNSYYRQRLAEGIRQGILNYARDLVYVAN